MGTQLRPRKGAQHCQHRHHHGAVTETSGDKFHAGRARVCLCEDVVMIEWRLIKARRAVMAFRFLYRRRVTDEQSRPWRSVILSRAARPTPWTRMLHRGTHFDTRSMTLDIHYRWLVAWSSGRALVFGRCAFAVLRSTCS